MMRLLPFAILAAVGCAPPASPSVPHWPAVEEVAHVRAEVLAGPYQDAVIPEFDLPAEYAAAVVRALTPPRYFDRHRMCPRVVGRVHVTLRDGSVVVADLLDGEGNPIKSPATFAVGGVPCVRDGPYRGLVQPAGRADEMYTGETNTLVQLIVAVHRSDGEHARKLVRMLECSAGRGPAVR